MSQFCRDSALPRGARSSRVRVGCAESIVVVVLETRPKRLVLALDVLDVLHRDFNAAYRTLLFLGEWEVNLDAELIKL